MAESDDWKQRLAGEYIELAARILRLDSGIEQLGESADESDEDESVRSQQVELMKVQKGIMVAYLHVLGERCELAGFSVSPITRV